MTMAGVITVFVTLFLVGASLSIAQFVDNGVGRWSSGTEMEIFMRLDVTQQQSQAIEKALTDDPRVKSFKYVDHDQAYADFKRYQKDKPALVQTVRPSDLPTSYRVVPKSAKQTQQIASEFATMRGVDTISTAAAAIRQITQVTDALQLVLLIIALLLLASSLFLIVITIRLATFARRREIEVMKLVGASNWFVRIPFMAEGTVQGLLGGAGAFGFVYFGSQWLRDVLARQSSFLNQLTITDTELLGIGFLLLLIGAAIGIIGSVVGLWRFLDA